MANIRTNDPTLLNTQFRRMSDEQCQKIHFFERDNHDNWLAKGGKTLEQRSAERVDRLLAEHAPQPLPQDAAQAVHAIVERAEAQYENAKG